MELKAVFYDAKLYDMIYKDTNFAVKTELHWLRLQKDILSIKHLKCKLNSLTKTIHTTNYNLLRIIITCIITFTSQCDKNI